VVCTPLHVAQRGWGFRYRVTSCIVRRASSDSILGGTTNASSVIISRSCSGHLGVQPPGVRLAEGDTSSALDAKHIICVAMSDSASRSGKTKPSKTRPVSVEHGRADCQGSLLRISLDLARRC